MISTASGWRRATLSCKENRTFSSSTGQSTSTCRLPTDSGRFSTDQVHTLWMTPDRSGPSYAGGMDTSAADQNSEPDWKDWVPDTKDWTWVLDLPCPECGLAVGEVPAHELADRAANAAGEWVQVLTSNPSVVSRPRPRVWSPLEYGAHVRDVYQLFDARLALMLVEDDPVFDSWDQDEAAIAGDYADQDPDRVADELAQAAESFVARVGALEESQWERVGRRGDGVVFTVTGFVRYFLHDVIHHLWDVTGQQDALASQ